jgi:replicative DNA helicase
MALNILQSDEACRSCLKSYAKKHDYKPGQKGSDGRVLGFDVSCRGIPKQYVTDDAAAIITQNFNPELVLDPVKWAAEILDWHCLDPDGSVWARKDPEEYHRQMQDNPGRRSKYHRPYQATMLRCSSKYKVFRIGRQSGKTESLVVSILFHMFVNEKFKVVLITPFQSQIDLIFKRLEDLINTNPTLTNSIKRAVKAPQYTLVLHNGSQIKGFTAGTKSGNGAASVRGQDANMLVFDEADYLDKSDLDSAMAIVTNYPDATVWMSSTPTGKRDKFYGICHDREWKEFHFPSHVNPNWSESLDRLFRKNLSSIGYKHEILADFGEQEAGIFQAGYVDAATADYTYASMTPRASWLYSIGVDWNSPKVGTTIYVTGFDPVSCKFVPVEHHIIQRDGWTQTAACEKIIELHRKWRPFSIYVDQGYGSTQIEIMRKYGFDARIDPEKGPNHIDAKLPRVIKSFDFGSGIEIRDPWTHEMRKKPAKGFLVENAVRRFENHDILISKADTQLKAELLSYVVKNVSATGQISYMSNSDDIGDHNLDALMLSIVGFTLEKSSLGNKTIANEKISFTPIDGRRITENNENKNFTEILANKAEEQKLAERKPISRDPVKTNSPNVKIDAWPGFMSDQPAPVVRPRGNNNLFRRPISGPGKRSTF